MRRIGTMLLAAAAIAAIAAPSFALPRPPKPGKVHRRAQRGARHQVARARLRVRVAPPAPRVVVRTPSPTTKHVYVGGYWRWDPVGVTHVWVDPVWKLPPAEGKVWHAGYWEKDGDHWEWEEGEWESAEEHVEHVEQKAAEAPPR